MPNNFPMKLAWNSLPIALGIVISASTSVVLAEPIIIPESTEITSENSESTLVIPETPLILEEPLSELSTFVIRSSTLTEDTHTQDTTVTPDPEASDRPETETAEKPDPEALARFQKLLEADQLYLGGQFAAAEQLYRQVKDPFSSTATTQRLEALHDPEQLSPAGRVYWRMSGEGLQQNLESKIFVPLEKLVEHHPEFIPGQMRYAEALRMYNRPAEALEVLERVGSLYPNDAVLLTARIEALTQANKWLEASLAARQFSLLNPSHPDADEFAQAADENLARYQSHLRSQLTGNTIANAVTGILGFALTGNLLGPLSAIQTTTMMLRGESGVGERIANDAKQQLELVEDEEVLNYVQEIGRRLAIVAGRNDFNYEFHVINDDRLNAFALPGGKVFINAGAIMHTNSEAELAGLIAHELSHTVLSHGFQLVTEGNLTANLVQYVPYGGTLANLIVMNYSRDMERQADMLGTRLLASTGYAADGMRNLMVALKAQERDRPVFSWLSSHPATTERISYLETLIQSNGYNRYAYEGVSRHAEIQQRVKPLLEEAKQNQRQRRQRR